MKRNGAKKEKINCLKCTNRFKAVAPSFISLSLSLSLARALSIYISLPLSLSLTLAHTHTQVQDQLFMDRERLLTDNLTDKEKVSGTKGGGADQRGVVGAGEGGCEEEGKKMDQQLADVYLSLAGDLDAAVK